MTDEHQSGVREGYIFSHLICTLKTAYEEIDDKIQNIYQDIRGNVNNINDYPV